MRSREECCSDWPKPCSYHEGWADALAEAGPEDIGMGPGVSQWNCSRECFDRGGPHTRKCREIQYWKKAIE